MPQGKRKRSAGKTHLFFPDKSNNDAKKSTADATLKPLSLSKAWMRCGEGFDGCQVEKTSRSSERKHQVVQHLAQPFVFDDETSADESQKDLADIVWSSSDNDLSDEGSKDSNSQPNIAELSPEDAKRSQDIDMSFSTEGCSGSDVPNITDWQDDSDYECDQDKCNLSEAAESAVEISDSESISSDLFVSQPQTETESSTAIDIVEYLSDDPQDEPTLPATRQGTSVGDDLIPSSGKSASDWLKTAQILLQTPEKKTDRNFKTPEDSAKKRKHFLRGGLAERLNRLQNRERSAITFWRHQCESDCKIPLGDKSGTLMLKIIEIHAECSMQVALCQQLTEVQKDENFSACLHKDVENLKALFTRQTAAQLKLVPNDIIHIYPPWQKLTLQDEHISVVLNTHFSQKIILSPSDGTENKICCSSMMTAAKRLVPLSLVFNMDNGDIGCELDSQGKQKVPRTSVNIECPVSNQDKEVPSNLIVNNSLLDLVETQRAAGWKACIHVVVQRVYCLTARDGTDCLLRRSSKTISDTTANPLKPEVRICLLIQDAYGMFSELHVQCVNSPIDDIKKYCQTLEGKACRLSGMKILQRTTRGRAPGLFSLIDSLWPPLAPIKIHGQSQEQGQVLDNLPAPSFCYVLAVCHEGGDNSIRAEDAMSPRYLPPVIHSLRNILQMIVLNQRCSFWATMIYVRPEIQRRLPVQKDLWLYVTDTTLQTASVTSTNPSVIVACVVPSCVLDDSVVEALSKKSPCCIFFKDAVKANDRIICVERTVLLLQKPLLSSAPGVNELTGPVRLDELDSATEVNSLCTVKGIIIGVNEGESFSWPVCNLCGNSKLQPLDSHRRSFFCCHCVVDVSTPVIRRRLEVFLRCELRPECKVRLQLQQETISSLLSSCSSEDGRYQVSSVLGKEVGPMHCYVQCVNTNVKLEEICLLQAGTSGTQGGLDSAM
ncbi:DNA repair-scaffolding protein [Mixophyes fleayi]|uniref:DNA repair-scaffolding protein n=1 Tax=Mixophyes fleayi TaxID=3061075 RepID=UPI003F4E1785